MSETAVEVTDIDLGHWVQGTRFFKASDGKSFVIDSDLTEYPEGSTIFIRRPTGVLYCNADATVTDMVPDHVYPPGTTPEAAVAALGYTLEQGN